MNVLKGAVTVYLVVLALELMFAWPAGVLTSRRSFVRLLAWPVVAAWNICYILFCLVVPEDDEDEVPLEGDGGSKGEF